MSFSERFHGNSADPGRFVTRIRGVGIFGRIGSVLLTLTFALGCETWPVSSGAPSLRTDPLLEADAAPWTSLEPHDLDTDFDFVVVSDRTGEHREGVFRQAMKKVNLVRPAFVMSVGDLIEGYTEDRDELVGQWDEIAEMVAPLEMPFFYAAGNHDMSNAVMSQLWKDRFGPSYYSFTYKDVLFVVLNSELFGMVSDPRRSVPGPESQEEQMHWLDRVLSENAGRSYTFVIIHQPLWDNSRLQPDWKKIEEWLGTRPYTVLAGHFHAYTKHVRHDRRYITLATTGGGSGLRGLDHGEFDHFMLISMREGRPVFANLLLEGVHGDDVRSAETRRRVGQLERALQMVPEEPVAPDFRQGMVAFEVTNPEAETLSVQALFEPAGNLDVPVRGLEAKIEPGETRRFSVELRAAKGTQDLRDTAIPLSHWRLEGVKENGAPLVVERDAWLLPRTRFLLPRASDHIRIDGQLGDWDRLPFSAEPVEGSGSEASFRFGVRYDDDFLYLAADVSDSTPVHLPERVAREQDALLLNIDARPDPERSVSGQNYFAAIKGGILRQLFIAWLTPVETQADSLLLRMLAPLPEGIRQEASKREGGYLVEIAVPVAWLNERQGKAWEAVRIELSVQDFNEPGGEPGFTVFRPGRFDRGGVLPMPGSGTFERPPDS